MRKKAETTVLHKVLVRVRRYWAGLGLSLIMATVQVVLSLYIPILVGKAIDCIVGQGNVDMARVGEYLFGVALCAGAAAFAQWIMSITNNRISYRVTQDIRNEAFFHIQKLPHLPVKRRVQPRQSFGLILVYCGF